MDDQPWYTPQHGQHTQPESREEFYTDGNNYSPNTPQRAPPDNEGFAIPSASSFLNPAFVDPQLVGHLAEKGGHVLSEHMGRYTSTYFDNLKPFFDVDQKYVVMKILRLLFPFRKWKVENQRRNPFAAPRMENEEKSLNRTDMYIPTMGFVTFCLMAMASARIEKGIGEVFTRQVFWMVIVLLLETLVLKFGLYFLNAPSNVGIMKSVSLSGYKYVGLVLVLLISWIFGNKWAYYISGAYLSIAMVVFLVKSVNEVFVDEKQRVRFDQGRSLRTQFLVVYSLVQIPIMFFLSYSFKERISFVRPEEEILY